MYEAGLIYRGPRIVNWDPQLQTNVSDDEVDRKEVQSPFYTFQYGPFQIRTVSSGNKIWRQVCRHAPGGSTLR